MHDITGRKQAEHDLQQNASDFAALAEAVGELARSNLAGEALAAICRAAMRLAAADAAALMVPDPSGTGLRTTASEGDRHRRRLISFTEPAGSVRSFSSREPYFTADVAGDRSVRRSFFRDLDLTSATGCRCRRPTRRSA